MSLLDAKPIYKPFHYPWAYDAWLTQQRIHWLPEEVPLADDVKDWRNKLTDSERHLLTQIFRFFTQADVEVNNCYMRHYSRVFKPTEVQMMLAAFSAMETVPSRHRWISRAAAVLLPSRWATSTATGCRTWR